MDTNINPIVLSTHAFSAGFCKFEIRDKRFSIPLHGTMVKYIYRHVVEVTLKTQYNVNSVVMYMIMMEDHIFKKTGLEVQVKIESAEDLDLEEINHIYTQFSCKDVKAAA